MDLTAVTSKTLSSVIDHFLLGMIAAINEYVFDRKNMAVSMKDIADEAISIGIQNGREFTQEDIALFRKFTDQAEKLLNYDKKGRGIEDPEDIFQEASPAKVRSFEKLTRIMDEVIENRNGAFSPAMQTVMARSAARAVSAMEIADKNVDLLKEWKEFIKLEEQKYDLSSEEIEGMEENLRKAYKLADKENTVLGMHCVYIDDDNAEKIARETVRALQVNYPTMNILATPIYSERSNRAALLVPTARQAELLKPIVLQKTLDISKNNVVSLAALKEVSRLENSEVAQISGLDPKEAEGVYQMLKNKSIPFYMDAKEDGTRTIFFRENDSEYVSKFVAQNVAYMSGYARDTFGENYLQDATEREKISKFITNSSLPDHKDDFIYIIDMSVTRRDPAGSRFICLTKDSLSEYVGGNSKPPLLRSDVENGFDFRISSILNNFPPSCIVIDSEQAKELGISNDPSKFDFDKVKDLLRYPRHEKEQVQMAYAEEDFIKWAVKNSSEDNVPGILDEILHDPDESLQEKISRFEKEKMDAINSDRDKIILSAPSVEEGKANVAKKIAAVKETVAVLEKDDIRPLREHLETALQGAHDRDLSVSIYRETGSLEQESQETDASLERKYRLAADRLDAQIEQLMKDGKDWQQDQAHARSSDENRKNSTVRDTKNHEPVTEKEEESPLL